MELARGADMMLCMCWDDQEHMEATGETLGVCGTAGAAAMAQEAGVQRLVLVHIGARLATENPDKSLEAVRRDFDGEVILTRELMPIEL